MAAFKEFLEKQAPTLPRLPVPPLQQTIQRFIKSIKPLVTQKELEKTQILAENFVSLGGIGEKLQEHLKERAAAMENWMSDWWINSAYLNVRAPLPVYSSASFVFPKQQFNTKSGQIACSAAIIAGFLDFKATLESNKYPVERLGPFELDMSQFEKIYGTCRVPGENQDKLILPDITTLSKHILVVHNNHFFAVPVYADNGDVLNQAQLVAQLNEVVVQSQEKCSPPIGILTSENRTTWSKAYNEIKEDESNRKNLDVLEKSLFVVCIDGESSAMEKNAKDYITSTAIKAIVGGDSNTNAANRWYEHVAQFIVGPNGEVCLSAEHSPGEVHPGVTDLTLKYWFSNFGDADPVPLASGKIAAPQKLVFNVNDRVKNAIEKAKENLDRLASKIEVNHFSFDCYGKELIKSARFGSPDSFIQMAIQLAFFRLHGTISAQYESASTRRFLYGRTETIRSCSIESSNFIETMENCSASDAARAAALKTAMEAHREYVINAVQGLGVDRHLLGLQLIAIDKGIEIPDLFRDIGYTRSCHMRLSTSQVPSITDCVGFFAPVVEDGYGCCYNPRPEKILFGTSAFNSCPETSAVKFCEALDKSLMDMKKVLCNTVLKNI